MSGSSDYCDMDESNRSLSAPSIPQSCQQMDNINSAQKRQVKDTAMKSTETQTSSLSIAKHIELADDIFVSAPVFVIKPDDDTHYLGDNVTCFEVGNEGIEDSGVFDTDDIPSLDIDQDPRAEAYRAFRDRYGSDDINEVLVASDVAPHKQTLPTQKSLKPLSSAIVNRAFECDGTSGVPRVEVQGPTPVLEKALRFVKPEKDNNYISAHTPILDVKTKRIQVPAEVRSYDESESCPDNPATYLISDEDQESLFTRTGSLKVPLDIKKYYGNHYNSHILLVDEVSFPTEMQKRENSELLESEVQTFQNVKKKVTVERMDRNNQGVDDDEMFRLDMLPTLPTPEEDDLRGPSVGKAGNINRPTRFLFPPTVKEYRSLPKYHDDKEQTITDVLKPDDHLILTLLVMFCCNPVMGVAAFIMSRKY